MGARHGVVTLLTLLALQDAAQAAPDPEALIRGLVGAWNRTTDCTFTFHKVERLKSGRFSDQLYVASVRREPLSIYMKVLVPTPGREGIWREGWNDGKVRVHLGTFPDLTVDVDPHAPIAMRNQHHAVDEMGFGVISETLGRMLDRARDLGHPAALRYLGSPELWGKVVDRVEVEAPPEVTGSWYRLQPGEDPFVLSRRFGLAPYAFLYATPGLNVWSDVKPGVQVWVPPFYAGRAVVDIDREHGLPIRLVIWDDQGRLFEHLEYTDLRVDVGLADSVFDPANPEYAF